MPCARQVGVERSRQRHISLGCVAPISAFTKHWIHGVSSRRMDVVGAAFGKLTGYLKNQLRRVSWLVGRAAKLAVKFRSGSAVTGIQNLFGLIELCTMARHFPVVFHPVRLARHWVNCSKVLGNRPNPYSASQNERAIAAPQEAAGYR